MLHDLHANTSGMCWGSIPTEPGPTTKQRSVARVLWVLNYGSNQRGGALDGFRTVSVPEDAI
jgi:hypothetical protein